MVEMLKSAVNENVYMEKGIQVQLRLPKQVVAEIDLDVKEGRFKSRSDAVRFILQWFGELEKAMRFYEKLETLSANAKRHPEKLVRLEEV